MRTRTRNDYEYGHVDDEVDDGDSGDGVRGRSIR